MIVAEGALQYVPFAVLSTRRGRTLIVDHEIVVLPSASVLSFLRQAPPVAKPGSAVTVFADPVFDSGDPRLRKVTAGVTSHRSGEESVFERLPYTRREAEAIRRLAPGARSVLGLEATRDAVLSDITGSSRILHLATHAVLDTRRPELSGVVLSLVDAEGRSREGFLSVADVFGMNLHADLVVLSACRTALGKELQGEGLLSLTRAFLSVGALRVVSSLWKVSDEKTAALMSGFYAAMLGPRHLPPAAALRRSPARDASGPEDGRALLLGGLRHAGSLVKPAAAAKRRPAPEANPESSSSTGKEITRRRTVVRAIFGNPKMSRARPARARSRWR